MEKGAVFPLFYLPNVEFFRNLNEFKEKDIIFEKHEHYPKQTFRNRTFIASPNGKLALTVPVKKGSNNHTSFKDIKISNDDNWQRIHWLSLETSYRSSAYFEFYEDAFAPFYHKPYHFLFDYNIELLDIILKSLKMSLAYSFTESYEEEYPNKEDFRAILNLKKSTGYQNKKYFQVFEDRNSYLNNVSVLDLLFNQGPQATQFF